MNLAAVIIIIAAVFWIAKKRGQEIVRDEPKPGSQELQDFRDYQ